MLSTSENLHSAFTVHGLVYGQSWDKADPIQKALNTLAVAAKNLGVGFNAVIAVRFIQYITEDDPAVMA
jgi:hypothetical protein